MKYCRKIRDWVSHNYLLLGVAISTMPFSDAFAQSSGVGIAGLQNNWKTQMSAGAKVVSMGSGVVGLVMAGAGVLKLKAAADSQGQQVKYGEGLWRLGVGGALCAVPTVANSMKGAVTGIEGQSAFDGLDALK